MLNLLKPPPGFTKKGNLLVPEHHSVSDWDFELGALYRSLSVATYVSAPTSLRIYATGGTIRRDTILCRIEATQCLPQGELRNWLKWNTYTQMIAVFRNQAVLGTADYDDCYYIENAASVWRLHRRIGGVHVTIDDTDLASSADTWEHWRAIYWNGLTPELDDALCVELYKEVDSSWVKQGDTLYDVANQWKTSEINRSGFHSITANSKAEYWDDTEIWGPA